MRPTRNSFAVAGDRMAASEMTLETAQLLKFIGQSSEAEILFALGGIPTECQIRINETAKIIAEKLETLAPMEKHKKKKNSYKNDNGKGIQYFYKKEYIIIMGVNSWKSYNAKLLI